MLKPIHAKWLVDFYNHMTTPEGKQVISSGWSAAGITYALKNGETCLGPLNLFADIDPLVKEPSVEQDDSNMLQINEGLIQHLSFKDKKDLLLGVGVLRWKCFWCYSSGIVICNLY